MFRNLLNQVIYITLTPDRIEVSDIAKGTSIACRPEIAIHRNAQGKVTVIAFGDEAREATHDSDVTIVNPFKHARSLISDFTIAETLLKGLVSKIYGKKFLRPSPVVIMHPLIDPEGGFTQIEFRAMRELAFGAGAYKAKVWLGPRLSDQAITAQEYPSNGHFVP